MTLKEAEKIVQAYGSALADDGRFDGPASYASRLPHSTRKVIQAMKLWLAYDIQNGSLTQQFQNEIGTAASRLPYFIADDEARRLNTISKSFSPEARAGLSTEEFAERATSVQEVHEWSTQAMMAGLRLRTELADFVKAVQTFDTSDSEFWERVHTLADDP